MDRVDKIKSLADLINSLNDPVQREQAMGLLNSVLELHADNVNIRESIAELERDIKRLKDEKEVIDRTDNN